MAHTASRTVGKRTAIKQGEYLVVEANTHFLDKVVKDKSTEGTAKAGWNPESGLLRIKKKCDVPLSLPFVTISHTGVALICNKEIGKGGHSRCYRLQCENGHYYAMKAIPHANVSAQTGRKQLALEIRIHSQLRHPGIVRFLEAHCITTHWLLVLEYCPNGTLNDWLKKHKRMLEVSACKTILHVFDAVSYLHDNLVFHGDLKLSNILLDSNMKPKLCDFGFAKQLTSVHQKCHYPYGTPSYMAPEIVVPPQSFGLEADIWSLGVILYTLLYGVTPFEAKCTQEVYNRIARVDLHFPRTDPPISAATRQLIERMLHAEPQHRPAIKELMMDEWLNQCKKAMEPKSDSYSPTKSVKSMLGKLYASDQPAKMKLRIKLLRGKAH